MNLNEIRTAIRTLPGFGPEETIEILASMTARYPAQSKYSRALIDCFTEIQGCIEEDAQDTRPADESWKARQDSPLFRTFAESFDALDNLRIRGAI